MKQEERLVAFSLVESGIGSEKVAKGVKLKETEGIEIIFHDIVNQLH